MKLTSQLKNFAHLNKHYLRRPVNYVYKNDLHTNFNKIDMTLIIEQEK